MYLTNNFLEAWRLEGFACDWQAKKEYELYDFLASLPILQAGKPTGHGVVAS